MAGNGPQSTSPLLATDEQLAIHCMGDFAVLCPQWQIFAYGQDGVFAADDPWTLTSASVDFQAQGVAAQQVVVLTQPKTQFKGGGHLFAVDSATGNSISLRRVGWQPGQGQPPAPASGLSGVEFTIPSLSQQIDEASYRIKAQFAIDEDIYYRSSDWMYQGAEDPYRCLRDAVVFTVLSDVYESQMRDQTENGDFARKAKRYKARLGESLEKARIRWGPQGASQSPTNLLGGMVSR